MLNVGARIRETSPTYATTKWTGRTGPITRQRSKTRRHGDKVPTVTYRLWPETFALLKRYRSAHPVLALTTEKGKPWVEPMMKTDGKFTGGTGSSPTSPTSSVG